MMRNITNPTDDSKARVLVVENDPRTAELHRKNLIRWGYEPFIAEGIGEELLKDAMKKAYQYACHVALVDMRLRDDYDKQDKSGLDLVIQLKPTLSIIVSGSGNDRATVLEAITQKQAIDFVGKEEPLLRLRDALDKAIQLSSSTCYGPKIDISRKLVQHMMDVLAPGKPDLITEILKMLFTDAEIVTAELDDGSADTPSASLRKESFILKVRADSRQPFAVKITTLDRIDQEYQNYITYVKDFLPDHFYAQVETMVSLWHIGGIKYRFLGGGVETFTVFSKYYQNKSNEEICEVLTHLFEQVWSKRYEHEPKVAEYRSLFYGYSLRWKREKWLPRLIEYVNSLETDNHNLGLLGSFIDPVLWVQRRTGNFAENSQSGDDVTTKFGTLTQRIGHGDLQADNFFVSGKAQSWTIDYERTGYGPPLQDFVLLEFDIWVRLSAIENLTHFIQLFLLMTDKNGIDENSSKFTELVLDQPEAAKVKTIIAKIRELASRYIDNGDLRVYFWGILLNAIFRLVLRKEKLVSMEDPHLFRRYFEESERALLLACILCRRLESWQGDWPPPAWKSLYINDSPTVNNELNRDSQKPKTILFLSAIPKDNIPLQIEEEVRVIKEILERRNNAELFVLLQQEAVRIYALRKYLLMYTPHVFHFAGHADEVGNILLKNEAGNSQPIPMSAFGEMLAILGGNLRCVIFNACSTEQQAALVAQYIDTVIAMSDAIEDTSAIAFTQGFYDGLFANRSIQECFELGRNAIKTSNLPGADLCKLFSRIDASTVYLL